ncbi:MAG: hypothetical protein QOI51_1285 [Nocardioidaceae bacterium]|nr:hypothetical protein [Nocardioidaceae bacterium]MDX6309196.1 hypothetical protein [Nocardioidaceae bacterium]
MAQLPEELPDGLLVLDVREDDEWAAGHIAGASHIPMLDVPSRLGDIPTGLQVIVVCRVGSRSGQITGFLGAHGRRALNLAGGMDAWQAAGRPMTSSSGMSPQVI